MSVEKACGLGTLALPACGISPLFSCHPKRRIRGCRASPCRQQHRRGLTGLARRGRFCRGCGRGAGRQAGVCRAVLCMLHARPTRARLSKLPGYASAHHMPSTQNFRRPLPAGLTQAEQQVVGARQRRRAPFSPHPSRGRHRRTSVPRPRLLCRPHLVKPGVRQGSPAGWAAGGVQAQQLGQQVEARWVQLRRHLQAGQGCWSALEAGRCVQA